MIIDYKKYFLPLALIDVLFLPFLRPLPITLSLIPVLIWAFKKIPSNFNKKDIALSVFFIALAILSFIFSIISLPDVILFGGEYINPIKNNVFLLGIILIFFIYLFLFRQESHQHIKKIRKILTIYLYFNFGLAIVFWYDYLLFFEIRRIWTFSGVELSIGEFSSITRFTGLFSDPNNAAIALVMIYTVLFSHIPNIKKFMLYSLIIGFIVISTMSTTGTIAFALSFIILLFYSSYKNKNSISLYTSIILFMPLFYVISTLIGESNVFNVFIERVSENDGGRRFDRIIDYISSAEFLYTFFIGSGGTVFINGEGSKPHIGHLHLIFNYSFYAWVLFIFIFFRIRKNKSLIDYLPTFIFFAGFSINTGLIDFRFSVVAALISGIYMNSFIEKNNPPENR